MPVKWKLLAILRVIAVAIAVSWPLDQKIKLGLDLRGGTPPAIGVDT